MIIAYVLNAGGGRYPLGVFSTPQRAEKVIRQHSLEAILTEYPIDILVYDHNIQTGAINLTREWQTTAKYIQAHGSPGLCDHWHYEDGGPTPQADSRTMTGETEPIAVEVESLFVFNGRFSQFQCGLFTSRERAEDRIVHYALSGILTKYQVDKSFIELLRSDLPPSQRNHVWDEVEMEKQMRRTTPNQPRWRFEDGAAVS